MLAPSTPKMYSTPIPARCPTMWSTTRCFLDICPPKPDRPTRPPQVGGASCAGYQVHDSPSAEVHGGRYFTMTCCINAPPLPESIAVRRHRGCDEPNTVLNRVT